MRLLAIFFLLCPLAWPDDVIVCDPTNPTVANSVTRFEKSTDSTTVPTTNGYLIWTSPNNALTAAQNTYMNTLRGQLDSLNGTPKRHWKCIDSDINGILDGVTEMTQAEKDLVEAPRLAIQARSQQIDNERATNDVCNAEPVDLEARIDAAYLNKNTAAEIKATTVAIVKKLARCTWARTTAN
jgi:hypothetical protein